MNIGEPLVMLQELAQAFGLTIKIGSQSERFVINETIILPSDFKNSQNVFEIVNPDNHGFISGMFIELKEAEGQKLAICSYAFCIDIDMYLDWLSKSDEQDIQVNITLPNATPNDLFTSTGTLMGGFDNQILSPGNIVLFFRILSPLYKFEFGIKNGNLILRRNQDRLEMPIAPSMNEQGHLALIAQWSPTELCLASIDASHDQIVPFITDTSALSKKVEKTKKVIKTATTLIPISLVNWLRNQRIAPVKEYASVRDLHSTVTFMLQSIEDRVKTDNLYSFFWSDDKSKPRNEPQIHPLVHGLLRDSALIKGLDIIPEYQTGRGKLDFLVMGNLTSGDRGTVCVEFKNAHSNDLEHGLESQLPEYMYTRGSENGIYCVLCYKGEKFNKPIRFKDVHEISIYLQKKAITAGLTNIRVIVLDLYFGKPPSKSS